MVETRTRPLRAVVRFLASVMMVSGVLLISDAVLTLLWQEPISWLINKREQSKLGDALANPPRRVLERQPLRGDAIGRIVIPSLDLHRYVVEGTDLTQLRKGPGHYPSTPLPGERGTVGIAGHRTTFSAPFRHIDKLERGRVVILDMPWGRFVYHVQKTKIVQPTDFSVLDKRSYDRLIMSACHPLHSAAKRIVVFSRFVRREPSRVKRRR